MDENSKPVREFKTYKIEIGAGEFISEEITCPMCSAVGGKIKIIEDKSKILSYVGHIPMYAKKHVCKKCGYEF